LVMSKNANTGRIAKIRSYVMGPFSHWEYLIIIDACRYDVLKEVIEERDL